MTVRSGVIVVHEGRIALIERTRDGERYYAFPGGSVEPGELAKMTAAREAKEELGLDVAVGPHVATVEGDRSGARVLERYFLAEVQGGELGTGDGPEMSKGTHRAVWVEPEDLLEATVLPPSLATFVARCLAEGFPQSPASLDPGS